MDINIVKLKKYASVCSVLYVEDDEIIREEIATFLGRFFPDVVLAEDGAIGMELYKSRDFDVVITDINMPNMNGIEMIKAIKEIDYEQPILVTSAYNDSENLIELIELNINRFVLKPFNNKQFLYVLYKIAEELSFSKEQGKLEEETSLLLSRAQVILEQVHLGIVVLKENEIIMANNAFLKIGGFDSYETLQLESPEISILFEEALHCIDASSNLEMISKLKVAKKEDSKVRMTQNSKTIEYQVDITEIKEDGSYILTFTDITAIHNAMYIDEHTKLPARKYSLEKIELLQKKTEQIEIILINIKHFETLEKMYGKKDAMDVEIEFANSIRHLRDTYSNKSFIGYFGRNMFLVIPDKETDITLFYKELENIRLLSSELTLKDKRVDEALELFINISKEKIDTSRELNQIEIDLLNTFELM